MTEPPALGAAEPEPRYHHGDLRGALIAAGRAVLEEGGPKALTLREVARRANVSHAAPRHHFPSLRHFFGDCAADGFSEFDAALRAAAAAESDPAEALAAMGRAYVRFATRNRAIFRLMFDRDSYSEPTEALRAAGGRAYAALVEAVEALPGPITPEDLAWRVASIWSLVHGFATLTLEGSFDKPHLARRPSEELAARAIRAFVEGALAGGAPAR